MDAPVRRVRTVEVFDSAEYCGHWYVDEDTEPREVDAWLMSEDAYWDAHQLDVHGEALLCTAGAPELGIEYWCPRDGEWEDGETRRACHRVYVRALMRGVA